MSARKMKAPAISATNLNLEAYFQSDEIFKNAFQHSAIGMALVSLEGNWLKVNNRICDIVGYSEAELLNLTFQDITHPDDLDLDLNNVKQLTEGHIETYTIEKRYIRKDGESIWVLLSVSLAKDSNGNPLFLISQIEDINEKKLTMRALEESEFLYRDLVENTQVLICTHDMQGNLLSVNDAAVTLTGYPREVLLNTNLRNALTPESQKNFDVYLENIKKQGIAHGEMHVIIANDEIRIWEYNNTLRSDGLKEPIVRGMARDVTEQKQASNALQASENRYHSFFDSSPIAFWEEDFSEVKKRLDLLKQNGITDFRAYFASNPHVVAELASVIKVLDVNHAALKMYAADRKEALFESMKDFSPGESEHIHEDFIAIAEGKTRNSWDGADENLSGEPLEISLSWSVVPGHEHDYSKVIVTTIDITERKRSEQALRESDLFAHSTLDALSAHIAVLDKNGIIISVNQAWREFAESNPPVKTNVSEGANYLAVCDSAKGTGSEGAKEMAAGIRDVIHGKEKEFLFEYPCHAPHEKRWFNLSVTGFGEGETRRIVVAHENISERIRARQELQKSEERYKSIIEDMPMMMCRFTPDGTLTFINAFYCQYFKKSYDELLGSNFFNLIPAEEHEIVKQKYLSLNQEKPFITYEYKTVDVNGQVNWQKWTDRALFNEKGEIYEYQSIGEDITEQKKAEERLRKSEEHYRRLTENFPNGTVNIYDRDLRMTFTAGGEMVKNNVKPEDFVGKTFQEIAPPETFMIAEPYLRAAFEGKSGTYDTPYWYDRYYSVNVAPLYDVDGNINEILVISQNVTDRKQAEEKLRKSEEYYRRLTENFPNGIVVICDKDLRLNFLSGDETEKFNIDMKKYLGKRFQDFLPANIYAHLEPVLRATLNGERTSFELPYLYDTYYFINAAPLQEVDGSINEILIVAQNITEQKQANIIQEESERRYRSLFEDSPISLWEEDFSGVKQKLDALKQAGVTDFEAYFSQHPEVVLECASLVKILNVNKASVELFNAKSKADLTTNMLRLLRAEDVTHQFKNELIQIANGHTYFEQETSDSTLTGEALIISMSWSVVPGYEDDLSRVIVSIVDITERKHAEEERGVLIQELGERVKELTFLHNISRIFMDNSKSEDKVMQSVVKMLPDAMKHSDVAVARIGFNGSEFSTPNFKQTDWMISEFFDYPGGNLGVVQVSYVEERPQADIGVFLKEEQSLLASTAEKVQTYLKGLSADRAINRQVTELETLYESGLAISQLLAPRDIAQKVIGVLERKMNWHHIAIREFNQESNSVKLIGFHKPGISADEAKEHINKMNALISNPSQGLSGWATTRGKSVRVSNVKVDERYKVTFADIHSGMYVPLKVGERVIGSISVESEMEDAFTEYDLRLLETLAGQAAIAIENANLFKKLQAELHQRELAENAVRQLNAELENRVEERTLQIEATRRRLELATHAGQIGVWEYNPRENKVIWDERMHVIHHVPVGAFGGTSEAWAKYIHPQDLEKSQLNFTLAFTQTLLLNNEHRILWPDGTIRYVSTSAITVFLEDNTPDRIIGISIDITDRKNIEHSLKDSEAYARLLFDAVPDPVSVAEVNGTMVDVNKFFETQHQIKREDLHGKHIAELGIYPEGELQKFIEYTVKVINGENLPPIELNFNSPDNSLHTLELHSYPIEVDGRQLILSTSRDITTHKKFEDALKLANAEMESALQVKDEFLANMSHELRTPLNAILGISESLEEQIIGKLNDKQFKYVSIIKESGRHLLDLINDILDISKIEAGRMELEFHPVRVEKLCQASLRMIKELAQKKNIQVSFKIKGNVTMLMGDERRLKQVLVNLLSNAVKFTEEGKKIGLEVIGYPERNEVSLSVMDTGIGIAEEDLKYLFKPFVQLDAGLAREYQGTGLGLALVAQMVRLHGGLVSVKSEVGRGSIFTVTLPWEPEDQQAPTKVTGELVLPRVKSEEKRKEKILLVEDTDIITALIKDYLNYRGYEVIVAQNGHEAILFAKKHRPDVILMDVMMPIMNGIEATIEIRKEDQLKNTPIIALTALAMPGDRERCFEAGMTDYMSKPVKLNELIEMIEKCTAQG